MTTTVTDLTDFLSRFAATPHRREPLDERDTAIHAELQTALDAVPGVRVGDYVLFADGVVRRVSYDHTSWGGGFQTSDGGSFHVGRGWVSMSGSLFPQVPADTLTDTGETANAWGWFWHHDWSGADRGRDAIFRVRVFTCSLPAPR